MICSADTVVHSIKSYLVGESPLVVDTIDNITEVTINGVPLGVDGYLDLGHIDTMNDNAFQYGGRRSVQRAGVDFFPEAKWAVLRIFTPKLTGNSVCEVSEQ